MKNLIHKFKEVWNLAADFKLTVDIGMIITSILIFLRGFVLILYSIFIGDNIFCEKIPQSVNCKISCILFLLSIIVGIILMVLSFEVFLRIDKSYLITMMFLIINAILIILGNIDYLEILFTILSCVLLTLLKPNFYRKWASFRRRKYGIFVVLTFILILMYMLSAPFLQESFLNDKIISVGLFKNSKNFIYFGLFAYAVSWFLLFFRNFILFRVKFKKALDKDGLTKIDEFLKENKGDVNTHLVFLKDKSLYWTSEDKVLIQYAKVGDFLISLGDPIGSPEYINDAIVEFQNYADKFALSTAFYRIGKEHLSLYHENGYYFFKLGEEALVPLENFDLKGKKKQNFRTVKNKFERNNYKFEMIYPPYDDEVLNTLKEISNEWLDGRSEDKFSIGWFDKEYLEKSSIGIIKDDKDNIIAFASTLPYYDEKNTISIDLMRFKKYLPNGIMDLLFLHLILWAKDEGYKNFSLGMAPLSNVGISNRSHSGEKFAKFIFNYGNHWYNFKGLRYFKSKFDPNWQPHFLAYQKFTSLPILMLNISKHISKK